MHAFKFKNNKEGEHRFQNALFGLVSKCIIRSEVPCYPSVHWIKGGDSDHNDASCCAPEALPRIDELIKRDWSFSLPLVNVAHVAIKSLRMVGRK